MDELPCTPPSESQRALYSVLVSRIQWEPLKGMVGPDCVTGSNLPSHSDVHTSCLTGLKIQVWFQRAEVFFLADSTDYLWGCHKSKVPLTIWLEKGFPFYHRSRVKGDRQWHLLYKKGSIKNCCMSNSCHFPNPKCFHLHVKDFLCQMLCLKCMHLIGYSLTTAWIKVRKLFVFNHILIFFWFWFLSQRKCIL